MRARLSVSAFGLALLVLGACGDEMPPAQSAPTHSASSSAHAPPAPTITPHPNAMGDGVIEAWLKEKPDTFGALLTDPRGVRMQILFGEVKGNTIEHHGYRVDSDYFYPASAMKLAMAVTTLETLRARVKGAKGAKQISVSTPIRIWDGPNGAPDDRDTTDNQTGKISIGHESRKMLIVSDNRSYNRLFDFVGHREANERMWRIGIASVRARTRLGDVPAGDDARLTPEIDFLVPGADPYVVPERKSTLEIQPTAMSGIFVGGSYIDTTTNTTVDEPMSFADKNRISLEDLQTLLEKIVRPDLAPPPLPAYDDADRSMIADILGTMPSESRNPVFDQAYLQDDIQRPFMAGLVRVLPRARLKLYSKAGRAYGFTVDNAYVIDNDTQRSFFLTAEIYTNPTGVVGDDKHYTYIETSNTFLANIAELAARKVFGAP